MRSLITFSLSVLNSSVRCFLGGGAMSLTSRFKTRPKQTLDSYFKSLNTCGRGKTVERYTYSDLTLSTNLLDKGFTCEGRVKMEPCMMNATLYRIQLFCRSYPRG